MADYYIQDRTTGEHIAGAFDNFDDAWRHYLTLSSGCPWIYVLMPCGCLFRTIDRGAGSGLDRDERCATHPTTTPWELIHAIFARPDAPPIVYCSARSEDGRQCDRPEDHRGPHFVGGEGPPVNFSETPANRRNRRRREQRRRRQREATEASTKSPPPELPPVESEPAPDQF